MPYIHTYTIPVRHYECDATGRVHAATILNYLQEAAFDASAAVGYSAARYESLGLQWFAYETDLQLMAPLRYGDHIEIRTWVEDFRRVRSLRRYEVFRDGEKVAHAETDWVLVDSTTGRPVRLPDDIVRAYSGGEAVSTDGQRLSLPGMLPPKDAQVFTRHVTWRDIDPARHVNNAVYLAYVAEARLQVFEALGWSVQRISEAGAVILPRRYQIAYKHAALLGDTLQILTWAVETGEQGGQRCYLLKRPADGVQIAQVREFWVWASAADDAPLSLPDVLRVTLT